jgi:hypothetical protein
MTKKQDVITFKVDKELHEAIKDIPNRSQFIRSAILAALGSICPLCSGTGILTRKQKEHWDDFSIDHQIKTCRHCLERVVVCGHNPAPGERREKPLTGT